MPYQNNQVPTLKDIMARSTLEGKYYTYVKRKMENDVLVLKCIANEFQEKIKAAGKIILKSSMG